jgi:transposase InsO family protein
MNQHSGMFRITSMCRVLRVSRSGFYARRSRQQRPSARERRRTVLDERVRKAFGARKGRSGSPGLTRDLAKQGHPYDRKTVAESLRRQGLRAKAAKKFKATTDSNHTRPVAANLLAQDFSASAPNQKWIGDITYLWTADLQYERHRQLLRQRLCRELLPHPEGRGRSRHPIRYARTDEASRLRIHRGRLQSNPPTQHQRLHQSDGV